MAKTKRNYLTGQALKDFRHKVKILKDRGLTSPKVDARKQQATRYYKHKVKTLAGIFDKTQTSVKLKPSQVAKAKEAGLTVIRGRAVISNFSENISRARRSFFAESIGTHVEATRLDDVSPAELFRHPQKYQHLVAGNELIRISYGSETYTYRNYGHFIQNAMKYMPGGNKARREYLAEVSIVAVKMDSMRNLRGSRVQKMTQEDLRSYKAKKARQYYYAKETEKRQEINKQKNDIRRQRDKEAVELWWKNHPHVKRRTK